MDLADSDLLMLVNLTYLNKDTFALVKGLNPISSYRSVSDYLTSFDENALMVLEEKGDTIVTGGECSGSELAAMIRYMKGNEAFQKLMITGAPVNKNNHTMALCFEVLNQPKNAIITFYSTLDPDEWKDNAQGFYQADTISQREALRYIESLAYYSLTVVGHSKGGNKAQYVTILSDKVIRGVSFDSQGFSHEFVDKYALAIAQNANKIKNYSLSTDFVHPLLFPIPGAIQLYVDGGTDVKSMVEHHSPNAFYVYYVDSDGLTQIVCTKEGIAYLPMTNEDVNVKIIHNFSNFIQDSSNKTDKKLLGDFVGDLLYIQFNSSLSDDQRQKDLLRRLLHNPKEAATLFASILKYIETYQLKSIEIPPLLQALGLNDLKLIFKIKYYDVDKILKALRSELSTWEKNLLIYQLFLLITTYAEFTFNTFIFWRELESKFLALKGKMLS